MASAAHAQQSGVASNESTIRQARTLQTQALARKDLDVVVKY